MKKGLIVLLFATVFFTEAMAQPRAIGARVGRSLEASYQHSLSDATYLQADAGMENFYQGVKFLGTYNFIFATPQWSSYGKFEWFAGVGAGVGYNFSLRNAYWDIANTNHFYYDVRAGSHFFLGGVGNVGLSYTFEFPLQLSVDYRPLLGPSFGKYYSRNGVEQGVAWYLPGILDFGMSARYTF